MFKFTRYEKNPILSPSLYHTWEDRAVFNPGAALYKGKFYLLYRAIGEYENYVSAIGQAISDDGVNFQRGESPVILPEKDYEQYGIEDLRINPLEGSFYLTHTVLGRPAKEGGEPHQVGLIKTDDFEKFTRLGTITPEKFCSRNGILFPEKIDGQYAMLHRPLYLTKRKHQPVNPFPVAPSIWLSHSTNLSKWHDHHLLMEPQFWWENYKIGGGPPPLKTEKGWLFIYHGVQKLEKENYVYRAGLALLDLKDPCKVIFRTKEPILEPTTEYEIVGDVPNVVFPTGLVEKDGLLYLYYGAADTTVCLATCLLKELLKSFARSE